jgi:hypothetical protein
MCELDRRRNRGQIDVVLSQPSGVRVQAQHFCQFALRFATRWEPYLARFPVDCADCGYTPPNSP